MTFYHLSTCCNIIFLFDGSTYCYCCFLLQDPSFTCTLFMPFENFDSLKTKVKPYCYHVSLTLHQITPDNITWNHILPCHILSHHGRSRRRHHATSYHNKLHHITPCPRTWHQTSSHHITCTTQHHILPHLIKSHHTTSYDIMPHHNT